MSSSRSHKQFSNEKRDDSQHQQRPTHPSKLKKILSPPQLSYDTPKKSDSDNLMSFEIRGKVV
jgi:hypothetical protein